MRNVYVIMYSLEERLVTLLVNTLQTFCGILSFISVLTKYATYPYLNKSNPLFRFAFFNVRLNSFFPSRPRYLSGSFPSRFQIKILTEFKVQYAPVMPSFLLCTPLLIICQSYKP